MARREGKGRVEKGGMEWWRREEWGRVEKGG